MLSLYKSGKQQQPQLMITRLALCTLGGLEIPNCLSQTNDVKGNKK